MSVAAPSPTVSAPARSAGPAARTRRLWAAMDEPALGRRVPGTLVVSLTSMAIMLAVALWVVPRGDNMWYSDALSHLTIARRITDSKAPGFQQLGTVWLPVPHLMLMPFVADLWLWYTGWSAALLGIGCVGGTTAAVYRITARLGLSRSARLVVLAAFLTDAGFMYAHTTALTEPVLFMSMMLCLAGLAHWAVATRPISGGELAVYAGVPAALAVLSRYEGWVLVMSMVIYIGIVEWRRSRPAYASTWRLVRFIALRRLLPAVLPPGLGIAWWLAYNYALYGDPLEFMFGQFSAFAQQTAISTYGTLTTKSHLGISLYVYNWSVLETVGAVAIVLGAVGFCLMLYRRGLDTATLVVGVLFGTYVFEVASLYLGMSVMNNDHSLPHGLFNVRYGIQPLPFFALAAGFLVDDLRDGVRRLLPALPRLTALVPAAAVTALLLQLGWVLRDPVAHAPLIGEGAYNNATRPDAAAAYLRDHYRPGDGILMDESAASNGIIPLVEVPVKEYWNRSTGDLFEEALASPADHARWLFINTQETGGMNLDGLDAVYAAMLNHPQSFVAYTLVFSTPDHAVYRRQW